MVILQPFHFKRHTCSARLQRLTAVATVATTVGADRGIDLHHLRSKDKRLTMQISGECSRKVTFLKFEGVLVKVSSLYSSILD